MTFAAVIRAAIPDATDETCEFILFGRTPFPVGAVTAKSIYQAAARFRRANSNGLRLCEFCDRIVIPPSWTCPRCDKALREAD